MRMCDVPNLSIAIVSPDEVFDLSRLDEELQCKDWGVVEGGHDLDRAHLKIQLSGRLLLIHSWRGHTHLLYLLASCIICYVERRSGEICYS
jgi:hypothetical protein